MFVWLEFAACSALIVVSGVYLSKYGDVIAEKTGLGRAWTGLILMASITSLPELITGISSVVAAGVPEIAMGDILGSCVFNLIILSLMDMGASRPIFLGASRSHILSGGFGVVLIGMVLVSILLPVGVPQLGHVALYTPLIILVYLVGIRAVYYYEKRVIVEFVEEAAERLQYVHISTARAVGIYVVNAAVVVAAAAWLPFIADELSASTGLGEGFVGSIFVAWTTSLPEVVVSMAAVRIGAQDLAIGNLLGSNMFNILILAVDDVFYTAGPFLSHVSASHAVTGLMAMIMTGVAIIGLTYRPEKKAFMRLGWDSLFMLAAGVVNIALLYAMRNGT